MSSPTGIHSYSQPFGRFSTFLLLILSLNVKFDCTPEALPCLRPPLLLASLATAAAAEGVSFVTCYALFSS